jgi:hypothetical protein
MSGVRDRKRKMVTGLNETYMENYRRTGAEFILGTGRFIVRKPLRLLWLMGLPLTARRERNRQYRYSGGAANSRSGAADAHHGD